MVKIKWRVEGLPILIDEYINLNIKNEDLPF